ncbi:MAG: dipeptide epimerase [Isosphaeraceae bacterium]|nr:dipeptide epimerase [Isosphaeraceae bacterium]
MISIRSCQVLHVAVPLASKIKHASHERTTSENIIVRVALSDGSLGFGEGVPRSYVTGETIESAFDHLRGVDLQRLVGGVDSVERLIERLSGWQLESIANDPRGMYGNAARCALETALLDAYGRSWGMSVGEILRRAPIAEDLLTPSPRPVRYSGAITAASPRKERISAWKMRIYGFHQVKIKVGVPGQDDPARLQALRRILGSRIDIRIDANEAWECDELLDRVEPLRRFSISALEQPVPHAQVGGLAELRPRLGIPIMLDESLCGLPDAAAAIDEGTADILNVRLSKCGGFFPSMRIVALARKAGLGIQLGCHPGETGLLSAAGRHFASNIDSLRYVEGSYDRHVLASNPTTPDITFRYGGRAGVLDRPGLGVEVDPRVLEQMTAGSRELIG